MLLPSYNSCEETYTVCAAAPVLMSLKTVYLYCAICFQRCEVAGVGGKVAVLSLMPRGRFCITSDNVDGSLPI